MRFGIAAACVIVAWGGSVAAQPPAPAADARESTLPGLGVKVTYRTVREAATRARCAPGETPLSAYGPRGGPQPDLVDDPEAPGGKAATGAAVPYTLVCAR